MASNQPDPTKKEYFQKLLDDFKSWAAQTNPPQLSYNEARIETLELLARAQTDTQEVKK